ncbi:MAG TPA: hypothetical protein VJN43_02215 [Bryobacteraceae bacterium]|nr:hypothetical protein [Bryobacteraceae bacterium]
MFDTCTHRCGYCWLAESGQVLDLSQLEPFRNPAYIDKIVSFFLSNARGVRWLLQLTGGEPLIAPNLDRLLNPLIAQDHRVSVYTALLIGSNHPGFRFLLAHSYPQVDYIMASFHPEAELDEIRYFEKIRMLKEAGHKVFLRYIGQPQRLGRLQELSDRCRDLDVCFYPTTLLSKNYPGAYTPAQKDLLRSHFSSLSQHIQLEGGLDTHDLVCHAGSRLISINLQTGNITPCITVPGPSLGNVFENRLELRDEPGRCPSPGITCLCDVHFQQNIIISVEDRSRFEIQRNGFTPPQDFQPEMAALQQKGVHFFPHREMRIGGVAEDTRPFYTIDEIRENYRKNRGLPRTKLNRKNLRELAGAIQEIQSVSSKASVLRDSSIRIVTPEGRWQYAAALPLTISGNVSGDIWVRVKATVLRGEAGFGVLNHGGQEFQDRCVVAAGTEFCTVFLQMANPSEAESVMIQNATPDGHPAEIVLEEATVLESSGA